MILKIWQNRHVMHVKLEEEGSELQCTNREEKVNLILHADFTLPLSRPTKLVGIPKHIIQCHFSGSSELLAADIAVNNSATTNVQS